MTRMNKLTALAAVVALSVGLAACGGGSSKKAMMDDDDTDEVVVKTPQEMCEEAGNTWVNGVCKTDAELTAEAKAATELADTKEDAIETEGDSTTTAARPFDGTAFDTSDGADNTGNNYQVTVEHMGGAVKVTVVDGHGDYDAKNDPKFARAAMFGNGQMLVRNDGTDREIIVLHTDIAAPVAHRFGTTASGYSLTTDIDADTSAPDSYVVQTGDASKLGGSRIVSSDPGTKTLSQWEATGDNAANVYAGTLDGAAGTFRCQDTGGCTVTTADDDDNTVTFTGTLWFTPNAGATVDIADSDYLTYGFWLGTTTKDGEIASYDTVQTFATSSLPTATALDSVTGTASYAGDAAGVYVHETFNEDGSRKGATSGRFTADVALMAYFGETTLRNASTIEGTISDFDLDGGTENSWNVDVSASFTAAGVLENGEASGMEDDEGSLSGQFHSPADREATDAPPVLVGEFNANFVNGMVAGAYGARVEE